MNENSEVLNNAATVLRGGGGVVKHNYAGMDLRDHMVDPASLDFRPREGGPLELAEGQFIGAYGAAEAAYWIPGRTSYRASSPIPGDGGILARGRAATDALICLLGFRAARSDFYLGTDRCLS